MRNKIIFACVALGIVGAGFSAWLYARPAKPLPPAFSPASNPYSEGVFANGIVESYQTQGENINIYPEVSGTVTQVLVAEGQSVSRGAPMLVIDDTVPRATVEQQAAQAAAALALLNELKAQPRKETLDVAKAQVEMAAANLKSAQDQLDKQQHAFAQDPKAVSRDVLDNDVNAAKVAKANLGVIQRQYELVRAGAWTFDIENQERQYDALIKARDASVALLAKYTVRSPVEGVLLSVQATVGSYISPQGAYDSYTQGYTPAAVIGPGEAGGYLAVRCYIDEILIPRLPQPEKMHARMFIRGSDRNVPLEFMRVQPYVSPKIQLSDQRTERVDLRVLPIVFRFMPPAGVRLYPGELVDVYVGDKEVPPPVPQERPALTGQEKSHAP